MTPTTMSVLPGSVYGCPLVACPWKVLAPVTQGKRAGRKGEGMRIRGRDFYKAPPLPMQTHTPLWGSWHASRVCRGIVFIPNLIPFLLLIGVIHIVKLPKRRSILDCLWQRRHQDLLKASGMKFAAANFPCGGGFSFASTHLPPPPVPSLSPTARASMEKDSYPSSVGKDSLLLCVKCTMKALSGEHACFN